MTDQQLVGYVQSSTSENITTIEFFHPQSNSLPGKILEKIAEEIHTASSLNDSNIIILKSAGNKTFCAGASFDELLQITNEEEGLKFFSGFAKVINAIRVSPKLVIARIQGKCVGGGVGLAAAADYAIALDTADIKLSELAVGIGPFVTLPIVIGYLGGMYLYAWIAGAILSLIDAMIWSELGAAFPLAGGSFNFLSEAYGKKKGGNLMGFLYVWQTIIQAPLVAASAAIGFTS
jgi:enoyl-CoA hydratase/carnithine racemase